MTISSLNTPTRIPTYKLIEDPLDDIWNIAILDGDASGLVYRYTNVGFVEETDRLRVRYNYQIVHNPTELTDIELRPIMSVILDEILKENNNG